MVGGLSGWLRLLALGRANEQMVEVSEAEA